jgi:hypothetical protein
MDAWISVIGAVGGAVVGALAALGGQWISAKTTERMAYRARQHGVLDDLSLKLATVREAALIVQEYPGQDEVLVAPLRALQMISPSIHDDELRARVDTFTDAANGFRVKPVDWAIINGPYVSVRESLTKVYKKLG